MRSDLAKRSQDDSNLLRPPAGDHDIILRPIKEKKFWTPITNDHGLYFTWHWWVVAFAERSARPEQSVLQQGPTDLKVKNNKKARDKEKMINKRKVANFDKRSGTTSSSESKPPLSRNLPSWPSSHCRRLLFPAFLFSCNQKR